MLKPIKDSDSSKSDSKSNANADDLFEFTPLTSASSPRFPSNVKTILCTYPNCQKLFNRPAKLAQHLRSHTNTRPYVCPDSSCAKDFLRESHLKHHIKSQHSDVRDYICNWEGCGKSFITGTRLRRHNAVHEGENKVRCVIIGCGQVFRKHGALQKHVRIVHEGKSPFVCNLLGEEGEECGAGFNSASMLKSHEGRVHGGKRFWCTLCPTRTHTREKEMDVFIRTQEVRFSTYKELQTHLGSEHPPTCLECGLQCKSQRELKIHIDILHGSFGVDERRTHACPEPECGRGFTKKGNLNAHIQTVHGEKKFTCGHVDPRSLNNVGNWDGSNACGRGLSTKGNLEEHIRTAHLGIDHSRRNKKARNGPTPRNKAISPLVWLTGDGYKNESGRDISCLLPGCEFRFLRHHDLEMHLRFHHGIPNHASQDLLNGADTLVGRLNLDGTFISVTSEDLEAEEALNAQFGEDSWMLDTQEGGQNNLLASQNFALDLRNQLDNAGNNLMPNSSKLQQEHVENQVIEGYGDQDANMIDPILR